MIRSLVFVCAVVCAAVFNSNSQAAHLDLSLNLEFNNPADMSSGGSWKVVGKVDEFGLAGTVIVLDPVNFVGDFLVPSSVFDVAFSQQIGTAFEIVNGSGLAAPVMDIGVIGGSYPSSYSDPVNIAILGGNPDLGPFTGGVELIEGTFDAGALPDFSTIAAINASTAANVFDATGGVVAATVATTVRFVVPEPATFALLGLGLVGLVTTARRRC